MTPTASALRKKRPSTARGIAIAAGIGAVLVVLALGIAAQSGKSATGALSVATVEVQAPPRGSDGAGTAGTLGAMRAGQAACFWITPVDDGSRVYLRFASQYSASKNLALLDSSGSESARPGDQVEITNSAPRSDATVLGCPAGPSVVAYSLRRS